MIVSRILRATPLVATAALIAVLAAAMPTSAGAATGSAAAAPTVASETGWLRLGHLSPDTRAVDVRVSALSGGTVVFSLSDVGYGDVSAYTALPQGEYAISMVAAGSKDWTDLALSGTVSVHAATATTVAAYGPSARLRLQSFADDLTVPDTGKARIRVIQASTLTPTVDVTTTTGVSIARDAKAGSATSYAQVPAGPWVLQLTGGGIEDEAKVDLAAGSVTTLFVVDTAAAGLTIIPILDSAAAPVTPRGGVQTGGGWFAREHDQARNVHRWGAGRAAV